MNSAIIVALSAVLAVASAGVLSPVGTVGLVRTAPVAVAPVPVAVVHSHSTGIVRGAPLVAVAPAAKLVRVARGLLASGPVPVAYAAPVAVAAPMVRAAPVAYAASVPVLKAAPLAYAAPAPLIVGGPVVKTTPLIAG